ncbi:MAG: RDD family protein [Verrucomicrobia bacterium]|nr:MAG: RDD family protein [Verrucomicrobiota bacterium]
MSAKPLRVGTPALRIKIHCNSSLDYGKKEPCQLNRSENPDCSTTARQNPEKTMNWYYVKAGQQAGPVEEAQLDELARSGQILSETLVWSEGMDNWKPYGEVRSPAPTPSAAQAVVAAPPVAATQAVCAECRGVFNVQDMIRYGNAYVCANCKPLFVQKLAEGARLETVPGELRFAGFWIRFGAYFLDRIILSVIGMVIGMIGGALLGVGLGAAMRMQPGQGPQGLPVAFIVFELVFVMVALALSVTYETFMIGKYGSTLGKMACNLKVVTPEGGQVSYVRAFGRYWAKLLSALICYIGFILAAFDDQKQALHDRICETRVVYK